MVDIDEGNHQQSGNKEKIDQCKEGQSEFHAGDQGKKSGEQLNHRIADRYRGLASTASSLEQDIAEHRNVIIPFDRCVAHRARRGGANNRMAMG